MQEHHPSSIMNALTLPNGKILDQSKFKELADDKINATKELKFVLEMAENILG